MQPLQTSLHFSLEQNVDLIFQSSHMLLLCQIRLRFWALWTVHVDVQPCVMLSGGGGCANREPELSSREEGISGNIIVL